MNRHKAGMRGQREAEAHLLRSGYHMLERNYRAETGEIDLIATAGDYIVFVEVKLRGGTAHGLPRESVGIRKQRRITQTALHYISANSLDDQDFRFDVIELLEKNGRLFINHIENAF